MVSNDLCNFPRIHVSSVVMGIFQDWASEDPDVFSAKNIRKPSSMVSRRVWDLGQKERFPDTAITQEKAQRGSQPAMCDYCGGSLPERGTQSRRQGRQAGDSRSAQDRSLESQRGSERQRGQVSLAEVIQGREGRTWEGQVSIIITRWGEAGQGSPISSKILSHQCSPWGCGDPLLSLRLRNFSREQDRSFKSSIHCTS